MDKINITTGKKVYIPSGCGYTDYTTGITRFCRALNNVHCTVVSIDKNTVYLISDDNRKLYTGTDIIQDIRSLS